MKLVAGASSDVGQVREKNEDSFLVDDRLSLFAVADGMGGHRGGAVASSTSLEALRAAFASGQDMADAIKRANAAVFETAADEPLLEGMGTTLTAVQALGDASVLVGHVGDSRAYLIHEGALRQVTEDHSLVEELVREGRLTKEQAEIHPQRSIITRALGVDPDIDVDVHPIDVVPGDRILLCSDGLTTMLRDRDIERVARLEPDPRHAADRLVDAANEAGGEDNITVLVLDVVEVGRADGDGDSPAAARPAPPVPPPPPDLLPSPGREPEVVTAPRSRRRRIMSAALIFVPVIVVIAIAIGSVGWYARNSYFVGLDGDDVVLYKGVPGGVLGWDPTVEERSDLTVDDLDPLEQADLANGAGKGSRDKAETYLANLAERVDGRSTPSTSSTTSTTRPRRTTTTTNAPTTSRVPLGAPVPTTRPR
jgi:protein phosphatase